MLDDLVRKTAPVAVTLVLVLVALMHLPIPGFAELAPMLPVMAIYYWSLHRPELLPFWTVFLIGLVIDTLTGGTLGFNALMLLLVSAFMRPQRRYLAERGFAIHWVIFVIVVAAFEFLRWLLMAAIAQKFLSLGDPALRVLLAIALYPCLSWFLLRVDQALLKPA
ncbi:MAG TPA: rod shape-determining protein MreD [Alphaproteobacteria bacterium]|nr:rod shape-determining protein MreD [Alphaproteobacteria bacterium]